jgi:hypothetical protein
MVFLFYKHGFRVTNDARNKIDAKLSSVIKGRECNWLSARFEDLVSIQSCLYFVKFVMRDTPLWLPSKNLKYSWEAISVKQPKVEWCKLIWCPLLSLDMPFSCGCNNS